MAKDRPIIISADESFDVQELMRMDYTDMVTKILIMVENTMHEVTHQMEKQGLEPDQSELPSMTVTFTAKAKKV